MVSKLDVLSRGIITSRYFTKGWGNPGYLRRSEFTSLKALYLIVRSCNFSVSQLFKRYTKCIGIISHPPKLT